MTEDNAKKIKGKKGEVKGKIGMRHEGQKKKLMADSSKLIGRQEARGERHEPAQPEKTRRGEACQGQRFISAKQ
ncbi:MAG: hypothetical protein ABSE95_18540 [Thermodesulfobacteriota bacterium]|jgi:hypothetical protein